VVTILGCVVVIVVGLRIVAEVVNYRAAQKYRRDHPGGVYDLRAPGERKRPVGDH
jgi:hypothetical protein